MCQPVANVNIVISEEPIGWENNTRKLEIYLEKSAKVMKKKYLSL
jgi:hypothetical protein